jgi:ribonucleoside-diphosphate reductase alpha chain
MGKVLKPNTEKVLRDRYYLRDPQGTSLETEFSQPCRRIADYVALAHLQNYGDFRNFNSLSEVKAAPLEVDAHTFPKDLEAAKNYADIFYDLHYSQTLAANSPTWFNAGNPFQKKMLSACFILHVPNDIRGIFKAVQDGAIIGKYGGGIGMDGSQLSPRGARTRSGGQASGTLSFMRPFQVTGETIVQGGRRRIAEMYMLAVWHPEILAFIDCKKKTGPERLQWLMDVYGLDLEAARDIAIGFDWLRIENRGTEMEREEWVTPFCYMNISVKVTKEFMDCVHKNEMFMLREAIVEDPENGPRAKKVRYEPWKGPVYDYRGNGKDGQLGLNTDGIVVYLDGVAYVDARRLWNERIMTSAHQSAEPGIMFDDQVNDDNPVKSLGRIHNSNPCGEYFQVDNNSCNLASLNLAKFVIPVVYNDPAKAYDPSRKWHKHIDWKALATAAEHGVRFLDYVITQNEYPIAEITETTNATRPVGLGVMGIADMLLDLQIPYGSRLAIEVCEAVMQWIQYHAWLQSSQLASEFGEFPELKNNREYFDEKMERLTREIQKHVAFPTPDVTSYSPVANLLTRYRKYGVRNCHVTVIAPTGTISLIDECSSGIEPVFAFAYKRQDTVGVRWYYDDRAKKFKDDNHEDAPLPDWFKDASSTTPEEHVLMQAAFQKWCDNAISKTCNMPEDATVEDVARVYDLAWNSGLKGCTVYREGSRHGVLIREDKAKKPAKTVEIPEPKPVIEKGELKVMPRPEFLDGGTYVVPDGHEGKLYITANHTDDGRIIEILLRENAGNEWIELAGRLVSLLLRSNVPIKEIRQQLRRVAGQSSIYYHNKFFSSPVQLLDEVLFEMAAKYYAGKAQSTGGNGYAPRTLMEEPKELEPLARGPKCPDCHETLRAQEGCFKCPNPDCGYSKCK